MHALQNSSAMVLISVCTEDIGILSNSWSPLFGSLYLSFSSCSVSTRISSNISAPSCSLPSSVSVFIGSSSLSHMCANTMWTAFGALFDLRSRMLLAAGRLKFTGWGNCLTRWSSDPQQMHLRLRPDWNFLIPERRTYLPCPKKLKFCTALDKTLYLFIYYVLSLSNWTEISSFA